MLVLGLNQSGKRNYYTNIITMDSRQQCVQFQPNSSFNDGKFLLFLLSVWFGAECSRVFSVYK